jgi:peptidoglycan/LPS O-acetylase OafA/YrhL
MLNHSKTIRGAHRFVVLDGIRGLAAIAVMFYHFFQKNTFVIAGTNCDLLSNSVLAVDFFFMLSGFVIAYSYGNKLFSSMSAKEYLLKRFIRLYPMFFIGVLFGALVFLFIVWSDLSTYSYRNVFGSLGYNSLFLPFFNNSAVHHLGYFVSLKGAIFPGNPPAWSLFFEIIASIAFVFLCKLNRNTLLNLTVIFYIIFLLHCLYLSYTDHFLGVDIGLGWSMKTFTGGFPRVFFGFSLGILLFKISNDAFFCKRHFDFIDRFSNNPLLLYLLFLAVIIFPLQMNGMYPTIVLSTIAPCLVLIGSKTRCTSVFQQNLSLLLGWLSYPVYCLHYPVGRAMLLIGNRLHLPDFLSALASVALTLVVSISLVKFIEEPTRRLLARKLLN